MEPSKLSVGMGEGVVTAGPSVVSSPSVGSCVVVTLHDPLRKVGGLAHVMLPASSAVGRPLAPFQCADTAVAVLLAGLHRWGARPGDLVAKMVGGASMFSSYGDDGPGIGRQNIRAVKHALARGGVRLVGWDVAGRHGRSVEFHLASGRLVVRALGLTDREL